MNPLLRLATELGSISRIVPASTAARYLATAALLLPAVARERSLAPVDRTIDGTVRFRRNGRTVVVPVGRISRLLAGRDNTPTFGGLREMYASDVYLRAFRPDVPMETVVDLGANRGLFSLLAVAAHGARIAVGVEPLAWYDPVVAALLEANGIAADRMPRHRSVVAAEDGPGAISLASLALRHGLERIDFLKCDIEGAEFAVLPADREILARVRNLAMELHPEEGDVSLLHRHLESMGFMVRITDQFGIVRNAGRPHCLYASRGGDLVP